LNVEVMIIMMIIMEAQGQFGRHMRVRMGDNTT
jgi:hypothetical protein